MPSRKTTKAAAAAARMPTIPKELIDQFVSGPMSAEAVQDISMAFKKALIERALGAELSHHLGYRSGESKPEGASNHRNGATAKTVLTEGGPVRLEVPVRPAVSATDRLFGGAISDKACSFFSSEYLDISQTSMQPPVFTILQSAGGDIYLARGGYSIR